MAQIHFTLQGKGGVGKSFISALLAQHFLSRGITPHCFDTDPVNQTFGGYAAFSTHVVRLGEKEGEINPRNFDVLMQALLVLPDDAVAVVDNGAATFMPLIAYMIEADIIEVLEDAGHTVFLHTVLTGGQALHDTAQGLVNLAKAIPNGAIVVWLNEYFGQILIESDKGSLTFEQSPFFARFKARIAAIIQLPAVPPQTTGEDIKRMTSARLTFAEASTSEAFGIVERSRLRKVWGQINGRISAANF
ncbi:P-loop NTPase family protein [Novispirillum itersonii]|uniref:hypothetical protein n=1 Tax=Novispirillum itersonii TaxID=189 RepID=UPI000377B250|nr:hypothetical protein [Novispirillum itersonii]